MDVAGCAGRRDDSADRWPLSHSRPPEHRHHVPGTLPVVEQGRSVDLVHGVLRRRIQPVDGAVTLPGRVVPGPLSPAELDLGDVRLTVPDGWEVYADEVVQDDRRLVRLREPATDVRVQAVTLTTVGEDLTQACRDLVTDQQQAFTGVAESVVVDVPLTGGASGVSCAFTGTRTSDTVAAKVEFTIIRRDADAQSLVFRDTVPDSVAEGSPVLAQLADMECAATETFGVVVGTC